MLSLSSPVLGHVDPFPWLELQSWLENHLRGWTLVKRILILGFNHLEITLLPLGFKLKGNLGC